MYWNNPLIETQWPCDSDPFAGHELHLFYNATASFANISTNQRLQDLCDWANQWLVHDGIEAFAADARNHYDMANLVKLNMWIADIQAQGIVKPWLILDEDDGTFSAGNGDSRLRCLECIPEISTVPAFVSTCADRAHLYADLVPVKTFDQFAKICGAEHRQQFVFRFTQVPKPYGLYWYEYASPRTKSVTPGQDWCVSAFVRYAEQHPKLTISKQWFSQLVTWQTFAE
jgi:hypothetical protein